MPVSGQKQNKTEKQEAKHRHCKERTYCFTKTTANVLRERGTGLGCLFLLRNISKYFLSNIYVSKANGLFASNSLNSLGSLNAVSPCGVLTIVTEIMTLSC